MPRLPKSARYPDHTYVPPPKLEDPVATGPTPDYHPPVVDTFTDADGELMVELADGDIVPAADWEGDPADAAAAHDHDRDDDYTPEAIDRDAVAPDPAPAPVEEDYVPPRPELPPISPGRPVRDIHGRKGTPIVFGSCAAEAQTAGLGDALEPGAAERLHARCPGALINGDGSTVLCGCPGHESEHRCFICGHLTETGEDFDDERRRCLDLDACADRLHAKAVATANTPIQRMIREVRRAGSAGNAASSTVTAPRPPSARRVGRPCQCGCGLMTGGGLFRPGHDAKLKSVLAKASAGGDVQAAMELEARGWPRPVGGELGSVELEKIGSDEAKAAFIAQRVAGRYADMGENGTDGGAEA